MKDTLNILFLVLFVDIKDLNENQVKEILLADWFQPNERQNRYLILINAGDLSDETADLMNHPSEYSIKDTEDCTKIDDCLKRWNMEDGFYHV